MKAAETICYALNRLWLGAGRKDPVQSKGTTDSPAHRLLRAKQGHLKDVGNAPKYETGYFVQRYRTRLGAYEHIGNHENVFKDKVVMDLGSGLGEGVLNLVFDKQVRFAIGVDIDEKQCQFARQMIEDYQITNAKIIRSDASQMPEVESDSVDVIVSTAVFEHVQNLDGVLREAFRVLKTGGILYAAFSPIWTHYYGSHIAKSLPFPWTHLIFSPETVKNVLARVRGVPPESIKIYAGLNQQPLRAYKHAAVASQFTKLGFLNVSHHPLKKWAVRIPVLGEYIAGDIVMFLQKPSAAQNDGRTDLPAQSHPSNG